MSPGCGFTMPKKKLVSSYVDSGFFSKDDRQRARKIFDLGMGARGKGQRLSLAPRCRSTPDFAKRQALFAITNLDLTRFILPHQHSAPARRPVPALPLQLQQTVLVTHYPVLTHHPFFLQPEHLVELSRRRSPPMIISFRRRRPCITPVVLGDVVLLQIAIGLVVASDPGQP